MYAIDREQVVRVGQRRSLMRRALVVIVPEEVRNRKGPILQQTSKEDIPNEWPTFAEMGHEMVSSSIGIVDSHRFAEAMQKARHREEVLIEGLMRTLMIESWLHHLAMQRMLSHSMSGARQDYWPPRETKGVQAPAHSKSSAS